MHAKPQKSPLGQFKGHVAVIGVLALLFAIAAPFKYSAYLDHYTHAGEELQRDQRLWERNCKLSHTRVDAAGKLDCDELKCFISKTPHRIALERTLQEIDVVGKLLSPDTWKHITTNLGAAGFVLVFLYIVLTFTLQYLRMRMERAAQRRHEACTNPLLANVTGFADSVTAYGGGGGKAKAY